MALNTAKLKNRTNVNITSLNVHGFLLPKLGLRYLGRFSAKEQQIRLNAYKKLLVVRHPLQRIYSAYVDKIHLKSWNKFSGVIQKYFPAREYLDSIINFTEFITLLANNHNTGIMSNGHWARQVDLCHPCNIHYDYIATLETMDQDLPYINDLLGIEGKKDIRLNIRAKALSKPLWDIYFNLSTQLIKDIYSVYRRDFELFGYELWKIPECIIH